MKFLLLQHAGEVYGEKAILATETRELQSRLLSLLDERFKSLSILDEVFLYFNDVFLVTILYEIFLSLTNVYKDPCLGKSLIRGSLYKK